MRIDEINLIEFSPPTLSGSFHRGLVFNKLWLIRELEKIKDNFSTIYILGSWYGNLSILLSRSDVTYEKIINVDSDNKVVKIGHKLAKSLRIDSNIEPMVKDANELDYRQLDSDGLVINCSCHDMDGSDWFHNIPDGVMVVLQTRDDVDCDLDDFQFSKILYDGSKVLRDPETKYISLLRIGIK